MENKKYKVYAKQVPPESQESNCMMFGFDEAYPDVIFDGNKDYKKHTTEEYDRLSDCFNYVNDYLEDGLKDAEFNSFCSLIEGFLYRDKELGKYSQKEINKWKRIFKSYQEDYNFDANLICECLTLMTKNEYSHGQIKGCCQGDWQNIYYPNENYSQEYIEIDYFNLGTEWNVHVVEEDGEIESVNEISGHYLYSYYCDEDKIKKDIAEESGCVPEEVKLYVFTGFKKISEYKEC